MKNLSPLQQIVQYKKEIVDLKHKVELLKYTAIILLGIIVLIWIH